MARARATEPRVRCGFDYCGEVIPESHTCDDCHRPFCDDHLVVRVFVDSGEVIEKEPMHCIECERERGWR